MMAAPVAMIVGAPVSEGAARARRPARPARLAVAVPRRGPAGRGARRPGAVGADRSARAGDWLPPADREWLARDDGRRARAAQRDRPRVAAAAACASGSVWLLCVVYFLNTTVTYGIFLWLPKILREASGIERLRLSAMTAIPFVAALVGMVLIGRHSDRTGERKVHVAACALTAAVGLLLAVAFREQHLLLVLSFTLSQIGQRSVMSVFWAIPPIFLGGTAAAAGIALINSLGNLGGLFGPSIMGWLRDVTGGYTGGLLVLAGVLVAEALVVLSLRLPAHKPVALDVARGGR